MRYFLLLPILVLSVFLIFSCGTESTPTYTLSTSVVGEGSITPSGGTYEEGETVTLTSTPSQHWLFNNWSGDGSGSSSTVTITMDRDKNVVGNFSERLYPLNITVIGEGSVEEEVIQSKSEHTFGTLVQLTPNPSNGWKFVEWSGGVTSSDEVVTVTVDGEVNVTVTFERIDYPLTITIEGKGEVEQEVIQAKTTEYPFETVVQLTSKPDDGWVFYQWTGDLDGNDNPQPIDIDEGKEVTSIFKSIDELLTIEIIGEGTVEIQQESFEDNPSRVKVTLTAVPHSGWKFTSWSGDVQSTNEITEVQVTADINVTAEFEIIEPELQLLSIDSWSGESRLVNWPYSSSAAISMSQVPIPSQFTLREFRLSAIAGSFEIENVTVVDRNNVTVGNFVGIENGTTIHPGTDINFSLVANRTVGKESDLLYRFSVKGYNYTFTQEIKFTSN